MHNILQFIAADVSKNMLDMAGPDGVWQTPNSLPGMVGLRKRLARYDRPRVVCEATGRYGRLLARQMGEAGIAVSIVNPRQVRDVVYPERPPCGQSKGACERSTGQDRRSLRLPACGRRSG